MGKAKVEETSKPKGAPAYMGQFASLMTILLAFFIILLTLGQNRNSRYKEGVGLIKNANFLTGGGSGLLTFARSMRRPPAPAFSSDFTAKEEPVAIGYPAAERIRSSLSDQFTEQIKLKDPGQTLQLNSTIRFERNRLRVTHDTQFALDQAASMLYSLNDYNILVQVSVNTGSPEEDRRLAAQRATWLMRYLVEQGKIAHERIRSAGFYKRLEGKSKDEHTEIVFLINRITT